MALAPPAANGLAILLMVVLGAKEYFGWTEGAVSESCRRGGGGKQCSTEHTTCSYTFDTHTKKTSALAQSGQVFPVSCSDYSVLCQSLRGFSLRTEDALKKCGRCHFICAGCLPSRGQCNLLLRLKMKMLNVRMCHVKPTSLTNEISPWEPCVDCRKYAYPNATLTLCLCVLLRLHKPVHEAIVLWKL